MQNTIMLLKLISQGEKNIENKEFQEHDEFFNNLENLIDNENNR
jgi:hypothetical protein